MTAWLKTQGYRVNRKRLTRLLRTMGLEALTPRPSTSQPATRASEVFLCTEEGMAIERINQVWSTDSTYIRPAHMALCMWWRCWIGLVALCFCGNSLSRPLPVFACKRWIERCRWPHQTFSIRKRRPHCISPDCTRRCEVAQIRISRDGRGRACDNIFGERRLLNGEVGRSVSQRL